MTSRILLVDDDLECRLPIKAFLEEDGFQVTEACSGVEALQRVREQIPDLIILDVVMPKLDGWATLKALGMKEATAHIPVLMLTVIDGLDSIKEAYDLGAMWFYTKPIVSFDHLRMVVRRILEVAQTDNGKTRAFS